MNNAQHNLVFVTIKPMLSDKSMQAILGKYGSAQTADSPQIGTVMRSTATMDAIKGYILNHNLKPGDPLPTEAELCADLGVSRSSVREAFRQLTALDIVTVHQGRGSFVGSMSLEPLVQTLILRNALDQSSGKASLRQVVSTRQVLDLGIAEDVVRQFSGTHNPKLHALVATMVERAKAGKPTSMKISLSTKPLLNSLVTPLFHSSLARCGSYTKRSSQVWKPQPPMNSLLPPKHTKPCSKPRKPEISMPTRQQSVPTTGR